MLHVNWTAKLRSTANLKQPLHGKFLVFSLKIFDSLNFGRDTKLYNKSSPFTTQKEPPK